MRIIAGEFRSRRLVSPPGTATRPTSDRLRESLFNMLGPSIEAVRVADLYAGTGALGLEAISRGAAHCVFVEQAAPALRSLDANLSALTLGPSRCRVERRTTRAWLETHVGSPFGLVFLDPPYEDLAEYTATLGKLGNTAGLLAPGATVIVEFATQGGFLPAEQYGALTRQRIYKQGTASLGFYTAT